MSLVQDSPLLLELSFSLYFFKSLFETREESVAHFGTQLTLSHPFSHSSLSVISKTSLLVHPCVFLLSPEPSKLHQILSSLSASPSEVSKIWSNPFNALLSSQPPNQWQTNRLSSPDKVDKHRKPQTDYRTYSDVPFLSLDGEKKEVYRLHRFRTSEELIKVSTFVRKV